MPRPTWIHTTEAGTVIGWLLQIVAPAFTRCCTHSGEDVAVGSMTRLVMPSGIEGCACRTPSKTHMRPKPIRSNRRPNASATVESPAARAPALARRNCAPRSPFQANASRTTMTPATSAWWPSREWKAETMAGLFVESPELIPGIAVDTLLHRRAAPATTRVAGGFALYVAEGPPADSRSTRAGLPARGRC